MVQESGNRVQHLVRGFHVRRRAAFRRPEVDDGFEPKPWALQLRAVRSCKREPPLIELEGYAMRISKTQQIDMFRAADAQGVWCTVVELQEFVQRPAIGGLDAWVARRRSLQLANGNPVDQLSDGSLRVARTGARLRRLS
jgi:hypothetical protein